MYKNLTIETVTVQIHWKISKRANPVTNHCNKWAKGQNDCVLCTVNVIFCHSRNRPNNWSIFAIEKLTSKWLHFEWQCDFVCHFRDRPTNCCIFAMCSSLCLCPDSCAHIVALLGHLWTQILALCGLKMSSQMCICVVPLSPDSSPVWAQNELNNVHVWGTFEPRF